MNELLVKKGKNVPSGSLLYSSESLSLPASCCSIIAPRVEYRAYTYASRDHVYIPVALKSLRDGSNVHGSFFSLVYDSCPVPLSSKSVGAVVFRRYYDFSHYANIVACYDIKFSDGSYLFAVPEFLLFPSDSSLSVLDGSYLSHCSGNIYLTVPYVVDCSESSSLFDSSVAIVPDVDTSLSSNFSLREFLRSDYCLTSELHSSLTRSAYDNLVRLVECVLQPARYNLGCPIYVSSGFRTLGVNVRVGGTPRSYHLLGRAADVYVPSSCSRNTSDLYDILTELPHVELINYGSFIHVAF